MVVMLESRVWMLILMFVVDKCVELGVCLKILSTVMLE